MDLAYARASPRGTYRAGERYQFEHIVLSDIVKLRNPVIAVVEFLITRGSVCIGCC